MKDLKGSLLPKIITMFFVLLFLLAGAEAFCRWQHFVQLDGFSDQTPGNPVLHHGNGSFAINRYGEGCDGKTLKLLLLGDSWMEDTNLSQAIGEGFATESGKCVEAINGGNSSYSPSLYLLKARRAFNQFGQFDYIIINIDETDIGDEWVRYRIPLRRNQAGEIIGVPFGEDLHSQFLWNGKLWAENSKSYLIRFLKFALFYNVLVPVFYDLTFCPDYHELMKYVSDPEARIIYKQEIRYFERRLLEMVGEISEYTNNSENIYLTFHPHLKDVVGIKSSRYLPIIPETFEKVRVKAEVKALDALDHVRDIHGESLLTNTFIKGDPFSHLTPEGANRYGHWIAKQVEY